MRYQVFEKVSISSRETAQTIREPARNEVVQTKPGIKEQLL